MKNTIYVDLDTDREDTIRIGKANQQQPESQEELARIMSLDIGTLCEALVVIIRAGGQSGLLNEVEVLHNCMKHLEDGIMDANLKASIAREIDGPTPTE